MYICRSPWFVLLILFWQIQKKKHRCWCCLSSPLCRPLQKGGDFMRFLVGSCSFFDRSLEKLYTLPKTNSSPLKNGGWDTTFLLGNPIFRWELLVSGRVYSPKINHSTYFTFLKKNIQKTHPKKKLKRATELQMTCYTS